MYFVQENDGLKVNRIVVKGHAATAGVKTGDVVVGLNDLDVRDPNSLTPLLKEFKPGDTVLFKLRRGDEYVALPLTLATPDGKSPTPAVTPRAMVCCEPSTVVAFAAGSNVWGVPCHINRTDTSTASGRKSRIDARVRST